ncbi:MAG: helix-turn-helix transcriptional regulator [Clostridia bacterium]|nr:helix-turn-helix transcriptional regulator [Clostridia bacterium]
MNNNIIGKRLKDLRKSPDFNLSQNELGKNLGVCNQTVSFWESGQREPDLDMVVAIAMFFNVTSDYLLGLEND